MISATVLQYCGYLNTLLLVLIALLFVLAQFRFRPSALDRLPFADRVKISLRPVPGEHALFGPEIGKLHTFRVLWTFIVILVIARVTSGLVVSKLILDMGIGG